MAGEEKSGIIYPWADDEETARKSLAELEKQTGVMRKDIAKACGANVHNVGQWLNNPGKVQKKSAERLADGLFLIVCEKFASGGEDAEILYQSDELPVDYEGTAPTVDGIRYGIKARQWREHRFITRHLAARRAVTGDDSGMVAECALLFSLMTDAERGEELRRMRDRLCARYLRGGLRAETGAGADVGTVTADGIRRSLRHDLVEHATEARKAAGRAEGLIGEELAAAIADRAFTSKP